MEYFVENQCILCKAPIERFASQDFFEAQAYGKAHFKPIICEECKKKIMIKKQNPLQRPPRCSGKFPFMYLIDYDKSQYSMFEQGKVLCINCGEYTPYEIKEEECTIPYKDTQVTFKELQGYCKHCGKPVNVLGLGDKNLERIKEAYNNGRF